MIVALEELIISDFSHSMVMPNEKADSDKSIRMITIPIFLIGVSSNDIDAPIILSKGSNALADFLNCLFLKHMAAK
jgi:hypothetical protein